MPATVGILSRVVTPSRVSISERTFRRPMAANLTGGPMRHCRFCQPPPAFYC
jgi:hypothetical protein